MFKFFNNVGIIEKTLSKDVIKKLKTCIKTTEKKLAFGTTRKLRFKYSQFTIAVVGFKLWVI